MDYISVKRIEPVPGNSFTPDWSNTNIQEFFIERLTYNVSLFVSSYALAGLIYWAVKTFRIDLKYNKATPETFFMIGEALQSLSGVFVLTFYQTLMAKYGFVKVSTGLPSLTEI